MLMEKSRCFAIFVAVLANVTICYRSFTDRYPEMPPRLMTKIRRNIGKTWTRVRFELDESQIHRSRYALLQELDPKERLCNIRLTSEILVPTCRGSFSAVSTPIFASKAAFFNIFQALHVFLCTNSRFLRFFRTFALLLANSMQFLLIFLGDSRFCNFSSNFSGFFPEFRRISMISKRVMSRFSYFREI